MPHTQVLFQTDFLSMPPSFQGRVRRGTPRAPTTLVVGVTGAKDTVIDLCTLSTPKAAAAVTVSKGSQACVKVGDTRDALQDG